MGEKREPRKDLPEREFDSDLNSPALSNYDDEPVDQRDSGLRAPPEMKSPPADERDDVIEDGDKTDDGSEHDIGGADNLSR